MTSRAGAAFLLLIIVVASGWWLHSCWQGSPAPVSPTPAAPPVSPTPPPAMTPAPRGYRLAGVAVGDPNSFAVVETPNGSNILYRLDDDIPGLGRLVHIEAERIVVQNDDGQIELWLMPAASPTPTRLHAATARAATAVSRTAVPRTPVAAATPIARPAGDASAPGSRP